MSVPVARATAREAVPLLARLEDKHRRTVEQLGRLTRLHHILQGELRRLRAGEDARVVEARLARWMVKV